MKERCRAIIAATSDGQAVAEEHEGFLLELFQYHDEWPQKAEGGLCGISTKTTEQGTRCFVLRKQNGDEIDISFPHAVRLIPSSRTTSLLPQGLRDVRSAARNAVRAQIFAFRDQQLASRLNCPITGEPLFRGNAAVDHTPPTTFDQLLFDFCLQRRINPLCVSVGSEGGTVAVFKDLSLRSEWQAYHQERAKLRLVSKLGNLQLPKATIDWSPLWS